MKPFLIFIPSVLFVVSCQNQKDVDDSAKESNRPNTISSTKTDSIDREFVDFWEKFRTAVIALDTIQIIELTRFPFQTRGSFDSDPTIEYNRKKFVRVFKAFLSQGNGEGGTELDVIKRTELPGKNDIQDTYARIGDFAFRKSAKDWKFFFAYLNYETIDSLKK
jgi:hypothetical protein